eukprot:Pgem_evm1s5647
MSVITFSYTLFKPSTMANNGCADTYDINPVNIDAQALITKANADPFKLLTVRPHAQSKVIQIEINSCKIDSTTNNIARKYVVKRTLETTGNKNLQYTIVGEEFTTKTECESGVKGKAFSTDTSSLPQEMLFFPNAANPALKCTPVASNAYAVSTLSQLPSLSKSPAQIMASCIGSCANKTAEEDCFYKGTSQANTLAHLRSTLPSYNTTNLPVCLTTTNPGSAAHTYASIFLA